ncbi:hypothetical protein ATY41_03795 [Leifsonia xyli subsp. xyli]|uniref:Uncharacterized protein n=2 Tax=Leifsonia xyli subsp. xyli TaxID=59736 RepID=Q6AGZ4_LEIXX|nr:hypothetical protein [Leifsonia xyli]AAT88351.1 hypothetical protein Lxx03340 [Leifsonia xyli subsp. xyli str. CTCB07]ODA89787.1 hypothetical protein ATY41_03795 [Leifsonia xyli subsp. xyli]
MTGRDCLAENIAAFAPRINYDGSRRIFYSKKDGTIWDGNADQVTSTQIARNVGLVTVIRAASNGSSVVVFLS